MNNIFAEIEAENRPHFLTRNQFKAQGSWVLLIVVDKIMFHYKLLNFVLLISFSM